MLKKTITYTDYNGEERTEDFYFNIDKAELAEMAMSVNGGLEEHLKKIIAEKNVPELSKHFKAIITMAYGEKTPDGKYFRKKTATGERLGDLFTESPAFSELYMELLSDPEVAADFVNRITPKVEEKK